MNSIIRGYNAAGCGSKIRKKGCSYKNIQEKIRIYNNTKGKENMKRLQREWHKKQRLENTSYEKRVKKRKMNDIESLEEKIELLLTQFSANNKLKINDLYLDKIHFIGSKRLDYKISISIEKKDITIAVSGYFDPTHIGHIEYLKLAKALGDKLIVILNNDEQAQLKKGKIFMPLNERKIILESLNMVDEVFISIDKDETVCKSLERLRPDIFAKGGDRNINNIPEAEICKKLGIVIVDGLGEKIQSSSKLIKEK